MVEDLEESSVSVGASRGPWTKRAVLAIVAGACAIQLVRPARTNPVTDPARTMTSVTRLPASVLAVLEKGCRDCHSNDTRWPWYSNVAPVSWFVIDHVNQGRRQFNYSDWAQYDEDNVPRLLKDVCELTRKGAMPMSSYLWMHEDARLSERDVSILCNWTNVHRRPFPPRRPGSPQAD
jgi:hypothetical protein